MNRRLTLRKEACSGNLDWEFINKYWLPLKRKVQSGVLDITNFYAVWEELQKLSMDWRTLREAEDIYTCAPGMQLKNISSYIDGVDYFCNEASLLKFIYYQAKLCGDESFVTGLHPIVFGTPGPSNDMKTSPAQVFIPPAVIAKKTEFVQPGASSSSSNAELSASATTTDEGLILVNGAAVDILADDIYCSAIICQVKHKSNGNDISTVKIHYIGWEKRFDEEVTDLTRLHKPFEFVRRVKAWAELRGDGKSGSKGLPLWPVEALLRPPRHGSRAGVDYLRSESRIFVRPYNSDNPYLKAVLGPALVEGGVWVFAKTVIAFTGRRPKRLCSPELAEAWQQALHLIEVDTISATVPELRFDGTYEVLTTQKLYLQLTEEAKAKRKAEALEASNISCKRLKTSAMLVPIFLHDIPARMVNTSQGMLLKSIQSYVAAKQQLGLQNSELSTSFSSSSAASSSNAFPEQTVVYGRVCHHFLTPYDDEEEQNIPRRSIFLR